MRIGIDVGGTNTDGVLFDGQKVTSAFKTPTTADVSSGVVAILSKLLDHSAVKPQQIEAVIIGTTHFTNALVERRKLSPVAIVRLGLPATRGLLPMVDWPADLAVAIGRNIHLVGGGNEIDGREISPLDELEVARVARQIREDGLTNVALTSVFSPITSDMETRAFDIIKAEHPEAEVTLSHEIGRIGFLERENAAILNASLTGLARGVMTSFYSALAQLSITAPLYISQNDGTLVTPEQAKRYPVLTVASGPTNSMRGAARIAGRGEAMVVDIGGTTSDVGMLIKGYPRESALSVEVAGVRTNFRMPDLLSVGLGGGSIVRDEGRRIGPDSVGHEITTRAMIFGGDVLTTTDIVVAAGLQDIGDRSRVTQVPAHVVATALDRIHAMVDGIIDRMKTSAEPLPVILVGGGSILVSRPLASASEVLQPEHASVANAIGAAIAQVGGEVDSVLPLAGRSRDALIAETKAEATRRAIAAGADPGSISIIDVEEVPLSYASGDSIRLRVKAVGDLAQTKLGITA